MKITVEGNIKEIKELLQAIASSEEQSKKVEDVSIKDAEIRF